MELLGTILQLLGSLAFLLYGMKMMSDGIQKSAGAGLQKALGFMTGNSFTGFITGFLLTIIIQSSGATTAMEVSFVNAGLMTLQQSVGVTLGANIGTTITAWIVVLFGFSFSIAAFAIPIFGLGYFFYSSKKMKKGPLGQAIMGFGMLFIGLSWLSSTISPEKGTLNFLTQFGDMGALSVLIGVVVGIIITALIHSSSAESAIVITMAYNHLVNWEFAAALVIGSNIGSTIDAIMAAMNSSANAKRTALIHVLFNIATVVLACIFFTPFLNLIDHLVPGSPTEKITWHIATLHTVLKTITSILCLPFTRQIAALATALIKDNKEGLAPKTYTLEFSETGGKENAASYIIRAEKEIQDMTLLVTRMFEGVAAGFKDRSEAFIANHMEELTDQEDFADQMKEQLTKYIINCSRLPLSLQQKDSLSIMQLIVDDLEEMTDDCYNVALLLQKSVKKNMTFAQEDMDRLDPYLDLARQIMYFIRDNINKHLDHDKLLIAKEIESQIDVFRHNLKKVARKKLEAGADVKTELLYIDLVRQIEKFGDRAYSIAGALSQL